MRMMQDVTLFLLAAYYFTPPSTQACRGFQSWPRAQAAFEGQPPPSTYLPRMPGLNAAYFNISCAIYRELTLTFLDESHQSRLVYHFSQKKKRRFAAEMRSYN